MVPEPQATVASIADATALILAGGLGTRLAPVVPDRPKPLADVGGRPFVAWLLDQLVAAGVRRAVLCIGHRGGDVQAALGARRGPLALEYSAELVPLGTGGALRLAATRSASDPVLVLNGDSFCEVDLGAVWVRHHARRAAATIVATEVADVADFGALDLDGEGRVHAFREKGIRGRGLVNAGIYVLARALLLEIPAGRPVSLECEVLPRWVGRGLVAHPTTGRFIDIGTPPAYARAARILEEARSPV
jgi:NDP-sugar pyrophosphorylase family protein